MVQSTCVVAPVPINKAFWVFFIILCIGLLFLLISIGLSSAGTYSLNGKNATGTLGLSGLSIAIICVFALFVIFVVALVRKYYGPALKFFFLPFITLILFVGISNGILAGTQTPTVVAANNIFRAAVHQ